MEEIGANGLNKLADDVFANAVEKKFKTAHKLKYLEQTSSGEWLKSEFYRYLVKLHSEISELEDAFAHGELHKECDKPGCRLTKMEEELADIGIRWLDLARFCDVDVDGIVAEKMRYNKTRPEKHGKVNG